MKVISGFYTMSLVLLLFFSSCLNSSKDEKGQYLPKYHRFCYVKEEIDKSNEDIKLKYEYRNLKQFEADVLKDILDANNYDFIISTDSQVYVNTIQIRKEDMYVMGADLLSKLKEQNLVSPDSILWYYKQE